MHGFFAAIIIDMLRRRYFNRNVIYLVRFVIIFIVIRFDWCMGIFQRSGLELISEICWKKCRLG